MSQKVGLLENKVNSFIAEPVIGFAEVFDHASFPLPSETGPVQNIVGVALLSVMKGLGASLPNLWGKWYAID